MSSERSHTVRYSAPDFRKKDLQYGILIWANSSKTMRNPLQTQLNKAARIMVSAPFGNIDLQPAYDYLGILDVSKLYMLETAKYSIILNLLS